MWSDILDRVSVNPRHIPDSYGTSLIEAHTGGMKIIRTLIFVFALFSIALATSACPEKGPMEKAGEKVDDAVDKTKDAVK